MSTVIKQWKDQVLLKVDAIFPSGKYIDPTKAFVTAKSRVTFINAREYPIISGSGRGEWNIGNASRAPSYRWTLELPVTSSHAELFRAFQITRLRFTLECGAADVLDPVGSVAANGHSVYRPLVQKWTDCYVTSCNKSITQNQADIPSYTIEGIAHGFTYKDRVDSDNTITEYKELLGSGVIEAGGATLDRSDVFKHIEEEDRLW